MLKSIMKLPFCVLDRKGLGKDSTDRSTILNKEVDYKVDTSDFRQRKKDRLSSNRIWRDIRKCQHACEQLDKDKASYKTTLLIHQWYVRTHKQGYEPEEFWYWASTDGDDDNVDDEDHEVNMFTATCRITVVHS